MQLWNLVHVTRHLILCLFCARFHFSLLFYLVRLSMNFGQANLMILLPFASYFTLCARCQGLSTNNWEELMLMHGRWIFTFRLSDSTLKSTLNCMAWPIHFDSRDLDPSLIPIHWRPLCCDVVRSKLVDRILLSLLHINRPVIYLNYVFSYQLCHEISYLRFYLLRYDSSFVIRLPWPCPPCAGLKDV